MKYITLKANGFISVMLFESMYNFFRYFKFANAGKNVDYLVVQEGFKHFFVSYK